MCMLLCRDDAIAITLTCLHSLYSTNIAHPYIYVILDKCFLFTCLLIFLNGSVLIANKENCSMLQDCGVPCSTSSSYIL